MLLSVPLMVTLDTVGASVSMEVRVGDETLPLPELPTVSVKLVLATLTKAVFKAVMPGAGVKTAVYTLGFAVAMNWLTLPLGAPAMLVTVMSLALKPVGASAKVKVKVAVCPSFKVVVLQVMASTGATLSTKDARLLATELVEVTTFELSVTLALSCAETV